MCLSSLLLLSHGWPFVTPWAVACQVPCPSHILSLEPIVHSRSCLYLAPHPCRSPLNLRAVPVPIVQSLSRVQLFATPWTAASQASLFFTIFRSLLKLMSIELLMPSNHLILCHPLLLLPSIFPSIRVFSSELALHIRWPKYWSISFSISPSNAYSGLISFRIDCFVLLAVQGTLKSLLQHHSSRASVFLYSAFFMKSNSHLSTWLLEKP